MGKKGSQIGDGANIRIGGSYCIVLSIHCFQVIKYCSIELKPAAFLLVRAFDTDTLMAAHGFHLPSIASVHLFLLPIQS